MTVLGNPLRVDKLIYEVHFENLNEIWYEFIDHSRPTFSLLLTKVFILNKKIVDSKRFSFSTFHINHLRHRDLFSYELFHSTTCAKIINGHI